MDQGTIQILFALLRSAVRGNKLSSEVKSQCSEEILSDLIKISQKHDLGHLIALGLKKNDLLPSAEMGAEKNIFKAVYRYEKLNNEYVRLCQSLESAEIPFVPLKGSVLRQYYPEPWMRTSCDIDILVHESDIDAAVDFLIKNCGYTYYKKGSCDVSLFSANRVHLELHHTLIGEEIANSSCEVLGGVWSSTAIKEGKKYWHEMTDAMFYFYHIAHMAKHFESGGCGIRPFIDLWILDNMKQADHAERDALLEQGNLLKFAQAARKLSKTWLEDEDSDMVSQQMEEYILRGGVYGTHTNRITIQQQQKGGRVKYALYKIFIPYSIIKYHYPILQKHRWLTPFMQVRRWCKLIFCGHMKRTIHELKYSQEIPTDQAEMTRAFLTSIGL